MLKILNRREWVILYIALGVVIFAFGLGNIVEPVLTKNTALDREIKQSSLKLKKYQSLLSQKDFLQKEYAKISTGADLPLENEGFSTGILTEIENLAKISNISIIDIRPETQGNLPSHKENLIELRLIGDMDSCLKFIYSIENSVYLLQVKKFQINAKPNSSDLEGSFLISQLNLE